MLIVSQDRKCIMNFDKVFKIDIVDNEKQKELLKRMNLDIFKDLMNVKYGINYENLKGFGLYAFLDTEKNIILGEYETEEKAKEVMQNLLDCFSMRDNSVFYMPEK